ncbi:MAG: efflux RND transporter permease subunit, partial [Pseudonocardiaceae bacterium]
VVWGVPQNRENVEDVRALAIDTPTGAQVRLDQVADVRVAPSPDVIEREGAFRKIDVSARVSGGDRARVLAAVEARIRAIDFPLEYRAEVLGGYAEEQAAKRRLVGLGVMALIGILLLLQACFSSWRLAAVFLAALTVALAGGVAAAAAGGGGATIGAAGGLLGVLGVAARDGILSIRRCQQLRRREDQPFGPELVLRGARERLLPTLTSAMATVALFVPFVVLGARPGFEILGPMAFVVIFGLATATLVTLFVVPALYLRFGEVESDVDLERLLFDDELAAALTDPPPEPSRASAALAGSGVSAES